MGPEGAQGRAFTTEDRDSLGTREDSKPTTGHSPHSGEEAVAVGQTREDTASPGWTRRIPLRCGCPYKYFPVSLAPPRGLFFYRLKNRLFIKSALAAKSFSGGPAARERTSAASPLSTPDPRVVRELGDTFSGSYFHFHILHLQLPFLSHMKNIF